MKKKRLKIGIIDIKPKVGGVGTFIDNFYRALKNYTNHEVELIDMDKVSISELNSYDILHFSAVQLRYIKKMLFIIKPKKILTLHGWLKEEVFYNMDQKNMINKIKMLEYYLIFSFFLRINYFNKITCPTQNTANKNRLKNAIIISNALFPRDYNKYNNLQKIKKKYIFVTYSSEGGKKSQQIKDLINLIIELNTKISIKVELHIFGKYDESYNYPYIFYHGYVNNFLESLNRADLFITLKDFPDLGYVEMEAGAMKIPIAKLKTSNDEEIIDNKTGILAKNNDDLIYKLLLYVKDIKNKKNYLGNNFYNYINKEKNWKNIIVIWDMLFKESIKE